MDYWLTSSTFNQYRAKGGSFDASTKLSRNVAETLLDAEAVDIRPATEAGDGHEATPVQIRIRQRIRGEDGSVLRVDESVREFDHVVLATEVGTVAVVAVVAVVVGN